jgi:hypothetical protein
VNASEENGYADGFAITADICRCAHVLRHRGDTDGIRAESSYHGLNVPVDNSYFNGGKTLLQYRGQITQTQRRKNCLHRPRRVYRIYKKKSQEATSPSLRPLRATILITPDPIILR